MSAQTRTVLVLGASGLIGRYLADDLRQREITVVGVARRFAPGQMDPQWDHELPILSHSVIELASLLSAHSIDVVVNCLGVLQGGDSHEVHHEFVERLIQAIRKSGRSICLVHISIPGSPVTDSTTFAKTKRTAEQLIISSGSSYAILRPGFVIALMAYGGSAMVRALAALPFDLPIAMSRMPFQPIAVGDISATVAWLAYREREKIEVSWDMMLPQQVSLGDVIFEFRRAFGTTAQSRLKLPSWLLDIGARLGDFASYLGWMSPMRTTAITELRRGVAGDPAAWMKATGIAPRTLRQSIGSGVATIQDKWFARLYLIKALMIVSLAVFWIASGFIAIAISYNAAATILVAHDFPKALVDPVTIGSSLMDMTIGVLIAIRRTAAAGLILGVIVSLGYMLGSAVLAPDLWVEPLGALVKTAPAIVLMIVALATLDNR